MVFGVIWSWSSTYLTPTRLSERYYRWLPTGRVFDCGHVTLFHRWLSKWKRLLAVAATASNAHLKVLPIKQLTTGNWCLMILHNSIASHLPSHFLLLYPLSSISLNFTWSLLESCPKFQFFSNFLRISFKFISILPEASPIVQKCSNIVLHFFICSKPVPNLYSCSKFALNSL